MQQDYAIDTHYQSPGKKSPAGRVVLVLRE
jgi:hypothetical protein